MIAGLVLRFAVGFVVLVAASYIGTTMALRGFFGREYYQPEYDPDSEQSRETKENTR